MELHLRNEELAVSTQLCVSIDGMSGKEADNFVKGLGGNNYLATVFCLPYNNNSNINNSRSIN